MTRRVRPTPRPPSAHELELLRDRIWADSEELARQGIVVHGVGLGAGVVSVLAERVDRRTVRIFKERYGRDAVRVRQGGPFRPL